MEIGLAGIILIVLFIMVIVGGIQSFRRNWILALLMLLFLFPLWVCWALVECFLPKPQPKVFNVRVENVNK